MSKHTYLKANRVEVMIRLLKIYSRALEKSEPRQIRREEVPEIFLEGGILDLSGHDSLTSSEDRLLGKLSVVKLRNANKILEETAAVMLPKISDPSNGQHLEAITVRMKEILNLWLELPNENNEISESSK